ncbi:F-box/WD repeat-containing protein 10 F-box and WD-40 domain-containing protein 10 [Collichthys lucidus]|uniref:F-box/WD repeat-containing protein 10 F-box and WD-40 domain-containing protein 10 n=1 Tax=Collichthys lucidus TaxID=240159 RepID=A0A4U5VNP9_COLLU|nr:F-box/WD repeat-containing protein 10 F-box and WD-40 domain-containing protein 10 [Collichthys lucidus]
MSLKATATENATSDIEEMKCVEFGRSVSACELSFKPAEGCVNMCGMCPSCVFAPAPPGSVQCVWRASDEFKRRFVTELLLRCRNTGVIESIQRVLEVRSWTLYTYARSRSPTSLQDYTRSSSSSARVGLDGRPLGLDMRGIWGWFNSSPDWVKTRYLCRLLSLCDSELLRMITNLTSVLLVRQKRGFLQFNVSSRSTNQDSEDPALMVVPGSLKSLSGVSRYRDFIGCLPVDLSKRILGLLDEHTLRRCQKVCRHWKHLAQETMEEMKFRRIFQDQIEAMMKKCSGVNIISPTYANIVGVPVPVTDDQKVDIHPSVQKIKPFKDAYAKLKTETVQMEERNVYCGAYFTTVLLDKEDPHRVMDYRGGSFMATGSKDRAVQLLYVGTKTDVLSVMKGHVGSIRAVLLCEDRDLVITASYDASIRCWCLKTDKCVMALYGHTGTVNCLDVHADRLVSGAKDCLVKVWSLHTGKHFEEFNFKHPSSVQCVKINARTVYSSCDRGLVKVWDMESASLRRVIDAHRSSVKCLFLDKWHFLSGDSNGQVMAWSINCAAKRRLMTFNHPKEVKSLTLFYLRVITGCVDGKIRIFNFLTGDCLREITAETETGRLLSLHFHDNSILVNTTSNVKRYQFAKVFWEYTAEGGEGDVSKKSHRKLPRTAKVASPTEMKDQYRTRFLSMPAKCQAQARERCATQSVTLSEKATNERIKKRGLHHPLTRDCIVLRVNAIQKAQCADEVSVNMEYNARLRDSWGPHTSQESNLKQCPQTQTHPHAGHLRRAKTCVPILKRPVSRNISNTIQGRAQPHSADTHRANKRASGSTTCPTERPRAPECMPARSLPNPECHVKPSTSLPRISPVRPIRKQEGFRLLTATQLEDYIRAQRNLVQSCEHKLSEKDKKQQKMSHVH